MMNTPFNYLTKQMASLNFNLSDSAPGSSIPSTSSAHTKQIDSQNLVKADINQNPQANDSNLECDSDNTHSRSQKNRLRTLRRRSSENDVHLHRTNRRTIQKPKKNLNREKIQLSLNSSTIKKLYSNQTLKGFKPTNLETIFEEPVEQMSSKKYNRNQTLSDGVNITRTALKKRRDRIRKKFGKKYSFKKISYEMCKDRLDSIMNDDSDNSSDEDFLGF